MSKWLRGGVPRECNLGGVQLHPAEDEKLTYMESGRGGPVHIAGDDDIYQESNPYLGGFNQVFSVDEDDFTKLNNLRKAGEKIAGYMTHASGETYNCFGGIANDGPLENDNGNVSIEFRGKYEKQ